MPVLTVRDLQKRAEGSPVSTGEPVSLEAQRIGRKRARVKNVEMPDSGPTFVLCHPDSSDSSTIDTEISVAVGGRVVKLEIVRGRLETQDVEVRDHLVSKGYRWMNEQF